MATSKHARYSPSTLKSYAQCPGYLPRDGESDASLEGSFLHALVEHDMDEAKARAERPEFKTIELTAERRQWAQDAYDYAQGVLKSCPKNSKVFLEEWVDLKFLGLQGCDGGTADLVVICPDGSGHLLDYKFGWRDVDPIRCDETGELKNFQFMTYGLGVLHKHKTLRGTLTIHRVQPKLGVVDVGDMSKEDVDHVVRTIQGVVEACHKFEETKDESMLRPNEELCSWCDRSANCPKIVDSVLNLARRVVEVGGVPDADKQFDPELIPAGFTGWDVDDADPVEVAKMMALLAPLEAFVKRFKRFALELAQTGADVPGYREFSTTGKATIISPLDALEVMSREFGVTQEEFIGACSVSLDGLKKLASNKVERGQKGKVAEDVVDKLSGEGLVDRAPGYSYLKAVKTKVVDED